MEESKVVPYSHHYRCFPEMIGSAVNQSVFMYLMDIYIYNLRKNNNEFFLISKRRLANDRNISWRAINASLENLKRTKIVIQDGERYSIDGNRFVSLIRVFNEIKEKDKRQLFAQKLADGDDDALYELGFKYKDDAKKDLLKIGGDISSYFENEECCQKSQLNESANKCHNFENEECCQKSQLNESANKCHNFENEECCQKSQLNEKYRGNLVNILNIISENWEENEFIATFSPSEEDNFSDENFNLVSNLIFGKSASNFDFLDDKNIDLWLSWVLHFVTMGCCLLLAPEQKSANKCQHRNKVRNKNKNEITENAVFYKGGKTIERIKKDSEGLNSDEENFNSDEEGSDIFSQDDENNFADLELAQRLSPQMNIEKRKPRLVTNYENHKVKDRMVNFSVDEIEEIISDLSCCLDRSDKIYINQLWASLVDLYGYERADEDGNIQLIDQDPEGMYIESGKMFEQIMMTALDETNAMVEMGSKTIRGVKLPVTAVELKPEEVSLIIDFQTSNQMGNLSYVISKSRFKNIKAELLPVEKPRDIRESRADDFEYMKQIIQFGDDKDKNKLLTPIEYAIYIFLCDMFDIDDNCEIIQPKDHFAYKAFLTKFFISLTEDGVDISKDEFFGTVFNDRLDEYERIHLRPRMFSADRIMRVNANRGFLSHIKLSGI